MSKEGENESISFVSATDDYLRSFDISRVFHVKGKISVTGLGFSRSGNKLIISTNDGILTVINSITGEKIKHLYSKKYGCENVIFTHHDDCILYTSKSDGNDHGIRYHSLYDNKYLRFFIGHEKRITSLSLCPVRDEFLSASEDGTIRLWNLNSPDPKAIIKCVSDSKSPVASYDAEGVVFAVSTDDGSIRLYDSEGYQDGPFAKFSLYDETILKACRPILEKHNYQWNELRARRIEFNPNGTVLLISTNIGIFLELDSFAGKLKNIYHRHTNISRVLLGSAYSPDGTYLATGSDCGNIFIYNVKDGSLVAHFTAGHIGPVEYVKWNPKRHVIASSHANTVLWTAKNEEVPNI